LYPFTQEEIEREAVLLTDKLELFKDEIKSRQEKKRKKIHDYVNLEAPWHKEYLKDLDLQMLPYNLDNETIDLELHRAKFQQEASAKAEVKKILSNQDSVDQVSVELATKKISKAQKSELVHYVVLRKHILNLFRKSLETNSDGKYDSEGTVHSIIFPTKADSDNTPYNNHNLWILDEKLNFTEYLASDKPINGGVTERADLLVFNKKVAFRGENEASNPITIFEFKRPQRDDFCNDSSKEDPIQQIVRYVNDIKEGKFKTPKGRKILVAENTPFYGYVVCDLTKKVTDWLLKEKDFKQMPDSLGWFQWFSNINLYIEVISWDKVLKDSDMNNRIFFNKLGID